MHLRHIRLQVRTAHRLSADKSQSQQNDRDMYPRTGLGWDPRSITAPMDCEWCGCKTHASVRGKRTLVWHSSNPKVNKYIHTYFYLSIYLSIKLASYLCLSVCLSIPDLHLHVYAACGCVWFYMYTWKSHVSRSLRIITWWWRTTIGTTLSSHLQKSLAKSRPSDSRGVGRYHFGLEPENMIVMPWNLE